MRVLISGAGIAGPTLAYWFAHYGFTPTIIAIRFAGTFAPKSNFAQFLRNQIFKLMAIPWIADLAVGRDLADRIALPDYK